jgi:hypothetical protein
MFVDCLGVMITDSRNIIFTTTALMYREFNFLHDGIRGVTLNTTAAIEDVPDIERQIRLINERAQTLRITLTFNKIPNRMTVHLVNVVVLWLNAFQPLSGVPDTYILSNMSGNIGSTDAERRVAFQIFLHPEPDSGTIVV